MALRRVVHDRVVPRDQLVQESAVTDVTHHELDTVVGQARDVLRVAGVGELVEHGHVHAGVLAHHVMDEVRPDEAAATGDDDVLGLKGILRHDSPLLVTFIYINVASIIPTLMEYTCDVHRIFLHQI